jgi:hypothetical protein
MAMEEPVAAEVLEETGGQRDDAVLVALALADEQLVLGAAHIVDGQTEAFAQAQATAGDELERGAIAAEADVGQQVMDLGPGEHRRKGVMILGADLGEDFPIGVFEQIDEEQAGGRPGLTDGLGLPVLLEFDVKKVVPELGLGEGGGVTTEMLVDQAHLAVISVPGAIGVVAEGKVLGEAGHRLVRMLVIDGIDVLAPGGADVGEVEVGVVGGAQFLSFHAPPG